MWGLCVGLLVCGVVLCALFSSVVILPRKRELAASILLCYGCMCSVSLPHCAMVTSAVWSVIVTFPDRTHLLFADILIIHII